MRNISQNAVLDQTHLSLVELNETDLRAICPAIYGDRADSRVSDRYTFASTAEILPVLRDHGFVPTKVQTRKHANEFSKHLVELYHQRDLEKMRLGKAAEIPRVILINSHDRSSRLRIMAGFFRLVCSNGMIVSSGMNNSLNVMHMKLDQVGIQTLASGVTGLLNTASEQVELFKQRKLSKIEQSVLANYAVEVRYRNYATPKIEAKQMLTTRRDEDKADDLWSVFNRVQENVVRGGLPMLTGRKSGGIKSFEFGINANRRLWAGAEAMNSGGVKAVQALRKTVNALTTHEA
jgi:hypothetical protein